MKKVAIAAFVLVASEAGADRRTCESPQGVTQSRSKIDAENVKARDAALAAAGLQIVNAPRAARGPQSKPAGNVVWVTVSVGCNDTDKVLFAVDKAGKAYRIIPKVTTSDAPIYACGHRSCAALCGTPPQDVSFGFRLPDTAVYSGEREVAWKERVVQITYDTEVTCTKHGQAVPVKPAPAPVNPPVPATPVKPAAGTSELEKLKAENEKLRTENADLKKQVERYKAQQAAEQERLKKENKRLSTQLK